MLLPALIGLTGSSRRRTTRLSSSRSRGSAPRAMPHVSRNRKMHRYPKRNSWKGSCLLNKNLRYPPRANRRRWITAWSAIESQMKSQSLRNHVARRKRARRPPHRSASSPPSRCSTTRTNRVDWARSRARSGPRSFWRSWKLKESDRCTRRSAYRRRRIRPSGNKWLRASKRGPRQFSLCELWSQSRAILRTPPAPASRPSRSTPSTFTSRSSRAKSKYQENSCCNQKCSRCPVDRIPSSMRTTTSTRSSSGTSASAAKRGTTSRRRRTGLYK